jgi:hypothetical protein
MNISKDESIITQVAAKIAADLVPDAGDINQNIADWAIAFDAVLDAIKTAHNVAPTQAVTGAFPGATVTSGPAPAAPMQQTQAPTNMTVTVRGTQHGPLPDWLLSQCAAHGVTAVFDNRDGLAVNPKRPWFKAADGTKNNRGDDMAFWPPRN